MPYSDSKTLKPSGTRSAFTFILCKLPISVSSAVPVFLHREHLRTSTQWSSVAILQICADGWQVLSVIARGLRGFGRRTCDRWRPGWSRCFSGKELIAGRHNLEACIEQPPKNDPGRCTRIHDDDREICGSEQVFEHLLRGELAHAAPSFSTSQARCQSSTRVSCRPSSSATRISATPKTASPSSGGMFSPDDMIISALARLTVCRISDSRSFSPLATSRIFVLVFFFMTSPQRRS